jgi:hypothetical protein
MGERPSALLAPSVFLLGLAGIALAQAPTSVSLNPATVEGERISTAQVSLAGPAPAGGLVVNLSSSDAALAPVPPGVGVLAGGATVDFTITTTYPVAQPTAVTITATAGGVSKTAQLTVMPPVPTSITLAAPSVYGGGGGRVEGEVRISGRPAPGFAVSLSSSNTAAVRADAELGFKAWETRNNFGLITFGVAQPTPVTISATRGGVTKTVVLAVLPAELQSVIVGSSIVGGQSRTGEVRLRGSAPPGGLVVQLTSSDAAVAVPANVPVAANNSSVNFTATTVPVAQARTATITATANGVNTTGSLTVNPPELSSVSFTPVAVVGGAGRTAQVSLNGPAPPGGFPIQLSSSTPAAAAVPASVTVPAGATTKTFEATTIAVHSPVIVQITATAGSGAKAGSLTILPSVPSSLTLTPNSIPRGQSSTARVTLNGRAPAGGLDVELASSNPLVTIPRSVIVSAGATAASFAVATNSFVAPTSVTITASAGGASAHAELTIHP